MKPFYAYLLRCADGSYYAGHTDDLERRVAQHQAGEIEGDTHDRRPVELVWAGEAATREDALAFELRLKGWPRAKREALIAEDWPRVSALARSRQGARASTSAARTGGRPLSDAPPTEHPQPELPRSGPASSDAAPFGLSLSKAILQTQGPQQRRALAKAITLLESTRADHRVHADALLSDLLPHSGSSLRLGISGVPGVGKSTFIEALGLFLIAHGHRVAVLAVDPSSSLGGGSILGDKTRMERLSVDQRAYIRPSPASGNLGGVAERTREALLVCEAAGHDVVIIETVGVGQSETAVAGMSDIFVLLQLPNAGDDLQAIKKGVMEIADLVVINKADLDEAAATRARAQITSALRFFGPHAPASSQVLQLSALKGTGIDDFWHAVTAFIERQRSSGRLTERRHRQNETWMWERIEAGLRQQFHGRASVRNALPEIAAAVRAGTLAASVAARRLLDLSNRD